MKLIVQIPCYNEEKTLPETVRDIPRDIDGIDKVEILIIDDGSTDKTVAIAEEIGVDHIIRNTNNKGLAHSFLTGLDACLRLGADIIVNTDGDNQYKGHHIPKLIAPILAGTAEIVVGNRQTENIPHFSWTKKKLQRIGSLVVRVLSETDIPDAVSGFRAFSREAAMTINIVSDYSHTIETIIQAGKKKVAITSVPIETNPKTRDSRLMKSIPRFLMRQFDTTIRTYAMYKPLRVFSYMGFLFILCGLIPSVRFLIYYMMGQGGGHIQSLILAAILFIVGFQVLILGLIGDVLSFNRKLLEKILIRVKRIELDYQKKDNQE